MVVVLLPTYLLNGYALYCVSNRRSLRHAWLAWVPIGSAYVLGLISDDYQLLALNHDKNRRIWLPLLQGLTVAMFVAMWVLAIGEMIRGNPTITLVVIPVILVTMAAAVVGAVIKWMATYDLFRSCEPEKAGVYLAICVVIQIVMSTFGIIREILMLVVCKKDLGMPALNRPKQEPEDWRPVQPRKEPWDI